MVGLSEGQWLVKYIETPSTTYSRACDVRKVGDVGLLYLKGPNQVKSRIVKSCRN